MARDLKITNQALDPNLYVYRQARDVSKTQVDWATLTKTLNDDLSKIRDEREKTREDTRDANRKLLNEIESTDKLSHETANTLIQGAAYDASQVLSTDFQLLENGQIKLKDYKKTEQRVQDNFTALKGVMDVFEGHFVESKERIDEGLANPDEIAANKSLAGFGNLQNIDIVWQPNGTMTLLKKRYDEDGNELPIDASNPANVIPIGSVKGYLNHKSTYVNPNESAKEIVDTLGTFITSSFLELQKVTSLEDFRNLSYEGKTNEDLINSMITELITTDQQKISMLNAKGYTEDDFTFDPKEAEEEDKILMINNVDGSGLMGYKFTEQSEADMKDLGRQIIERQLDSKITNVKGVQKTYAPQPNQVSFTENVLDATAENYLRLVDGVLTGDVTTSEANAASLVDLINRNPGKGDQEARVTSIEKKINADGTVDVVISREGLADKVISSAGGKTTNDASSEFFDSINTTSVGYEDARRDRGAIGSDFTLDAISYTAPTQTFEIEAPNLFTALSTDSDGNSLMMVDYVANAMNTSSKGGLSMVSNINTGGIEDSVDLLLDNSPGLKNEIDKRGGVNVEFKKDSEGVERMYIEIPGSNSYSWPVTSSTSARKVNDTINIMLEKSAKKFSESAPGDNAWD